MPRRFVIDGHGPFSQDEAYSRLIDRVAFAQNRSTTVVREILDCALVPEFIGLVAGVKSAGNGKVDVIEVVALDDPAEADDSAEAEPVPEAGPVDPGESGDPNEEPQDPAEPFL